MVHTARHNHTGLLHLNVLQNACTGVCHAVHPPPLPSQALHEPVALVHGRHTVVSTTTANGDSCTNSRYTSRLPVQHTRRTDAKAMPKNKNLQVCAHAIMYVLLLIPVPVVSLTLSKSCRIQGSAVLKVLL